MVSLLGKARTYTADRRQLGRGGLYSEKEWAQNRVAAEPFMRERSARGYRLTVYNDLDKTAAAQALVGQFDFTPFHRLGDIGGVPFLQAMVILDHHPHLAATLTDYDGASVAILAELEIFSSDRPRSFSQLDLEKGDFSALDGCDVLTMWAVDYALSDKALSDLFHYVAQTRATLLLAALGTSPVGIAIKNLKSLVYQVIGEARMGRRFHGWLRSDSYIDKLVARAGCRTERLVRIGGYSVHVIGAA